MPRSRRRRPERPRDDSLDRLIAGWKRTEVRRGAEWTVQPVAASQAQKTYICPGCGRTVDPGVAHVVVWRADGILGEAAALADRRHWHNACWRIG
ncbi:hypothetical protein NQ166_08710 [Microbacterium sp. zg.Y1090]|uniref:hypothetical protein n=1 Tax=Microbacterium TaxID=33882 RepID=UPI00214B7C48|nr:MULTISPECIES: hypothetical protein [unclassified Microbacterium]MCR2811655.1 hypothetical protein [Microbacterium sp. zg.Y1084]MCR2818907.1 hypothetical protein [Microbacterium sp. zg.Y1090]MDL5486998.1 hypothetical protein [Microbacterium sp. zg-Y1211]WIM29739.1 hypothetical protein QNO26_08520 [Microbacterium sp. zg-Y1090]